MSASSGEESKDFEVESNGTELQITGQKAAVGTYRMEINIQSQDEMNRLGTTTCSVMVEVENEPPVANLVQPNTMECTEEMTVVHLDASGSRDPNPRQSLTYSWYNNDTLENWEGAKPSAKLGVGTHEIHVNVCDNMGACTDSDKIEVTIQDNKVR